MSLRINEIAEQPLHVAAVSSPQIGRIQIQQDVIDPEP
jgi:hypothetical protein